MCYMPTLLEFPSIWQVFTSENHWSVSPDTRSMSDLTYTSSSHSSATAKEAPLHAAQLCRRSI